MKVILLKSVPKVGIRDAVVEIAEGYARNALFPRKLAVPATPAALAELAMRKQNTAAEKEIRHNLLDRAIAAIEGREVTMHARSNEQGNLFSKIHEDDIALHLLQEHRIAVDAKAILLPEGPIKKTGAYPIFLIDGEHKSACTLRIV